MMHDKLIESMYAKKYDTVTTSRKDIGDIYVDGVPINIKSNNIDANNYSPNLMSADKMHDYLSDVNNKLQFIFVDYRVGVDGEIDIVRERRVEAYHIHWSCLSIQCQGKGVIQLKSSLVVDETQTRDEFLNGLSSAYIDYIYMERAKLNKLEAKYGAIERRTVKGYYSRSV